jgi:pimeloyl-ACP methyl ester carboxylesterase
VRGDSLIVVFDQLKATYAGAVVNGPGVMQGAWTKDGTKMRLMVRCWTTGSASDGSPHTQRFITVAQGVQLEVLDWGGSGRPLVLLHGMGITAHDFDTFAPKLTSEYHVYGITRRGAGRSSRPDSGYSPDRLGDDVVAVLDSLRLDQPVLVGHSFAGSQLSNVGSRYPTRIAGLVYLEAAYPAAYVDRARDTLPLDPDFQPKCPCSINEKLDAGENHVHRIPVPALAIYAMKPGWDTQSFDSRQPDWTAANQAKEFERGVPKARVVRIPDATHAVFRSNEAQVISEMRAFISGLPRASP